MVLILTVMNLLLAVLCVCLSRALASDSKLMDAVNRAIQVPIVLRVTESDDQPPRVLYIDRTTNEINLRVTVADGD